MFSEVYKSVTSVTGSLDTMFHAMKLFSKSHGSRLWLWFALWPAWRLHSALRPTATWGNRRWDPGGLLAFHFTVWKWGIWMHLVDYQNISQSCNYNHADYNIFLNRYHMKPRYVHRGVSILRSPYAYANPYGVPYWRWPLRGAELLAARFWRAWAEVTKVVCQELSRHAKPDRILINW